MSIKRQQASDQRRQRIIKAATRLIAARADGNFTMQELAQEAEVSLATPYNLMGSKAAVLGLVFAHQIAGFTQAPAPAGATVEQRLVTAVNRLVSAFARQPEFFRNLWRALSTLSPTEHKELIIPVSDGLLQPLVQSLRNDALISEEVPTSLVTITLVRVFEALFEQWAAREQDIDTLSNQLCASLALCLLGIAHPESRPGLLQLTSQ